VVPSWVQNGTRETIPANAPRKLSQVIKQCWLAAPQSRPTTTQVLEILKSEEEPNAEGYQDNLASRNLLSN
jgi:hypothetical protein